jgi:hypothetical protein
MPRGGKRPGAGRPVGAKDGLLSKPEAREAVRQMITPHIQPMIDAQVANAKGLAYLVIRDKASGKFIRFAGDKDKLKPSEETLEIWAKDPSVASFTDLLNRAIDKPKEQPQEVQHTGSIDIVQRLQAARQRLLER